MQGSRGRKEKRHKANSDKSAKARAQHQQNIQQEAERRRQQEESEAEKAETERRWQLQLQEAEPEISDLCEKYPFKAYIWGLNTESAYKAGYILTSTIHSILQKALKGDTCAQGQLGGFYDACTTSSTAQLY